MKNLIYPLLLIFVINYQAIAQQYDCHENCTEVKVRENDSRKKIAENAKLIMEMCDSCILEKLKAPYGIKNYNPFLFIRHHEYQVVFKIINIGLTSEIDPFFYKYGKTITEHAFFMDHDTCYPSLNTMELDYIGTMIKLNGFEDALKKDFDETNPFNEGIIAKVKKEIPILHQMLPTKTEFSTIDAKYKSIEIEDELYLQFDCFQTPIKIRFNEE